MTDRSRVLGVEVQARKAMYRNSPASRLINNQNLTIG